MNSALAFVSLSFDVTALAQPSIQGHLTRGLLFRAAGGEVSLQARAPPFFLAMGAPEYDKYFSTS